MDFTDFLINAGLLLVMTTLSSYFRYQWQRSHATKEIALGILYGLVAIIAMSIPMRLAPGAIFDGRSIVLSIAGLFESPLVVILAGVLGSAYRVYLGGVGTLTGVGSLVLSGAIGFIFKFFMQKKRVRINPGNLLLMGFCTHIVLLGWFITFPRETFLLIIRHVSLPYLIVFPPTTMLIGMFMESQNQRLRIENQLVLSEKKYRDLVTNLHEGVWLIDESERTTYVNPSMAEMLGYTPQEMLARPVFDFVDPQNHDAISAHIARRRKGEREQYERDFIRKDGSALHALVSVAPLMDEKGEYLGSLAGVQDISRRLEAEKRLEAQSRRLEHMVRARTRELESAQAQLLQKEKLATLGQLAGSVGHELRNPLTVIANAVYLLRTSLPERNEQTEGYLRMIDSEVKTASRIIADLLDYASARVSPPEALDVAAMVAKILEDTDIPAGIKVERKISGNLPRAFANPGQVRQILANLFSNACQAMPEGGALTVTAARYRGRVRLTVADTGVGISKENMTRLFEPLFTTKPKGIGLGLALSKTLAEMNEMTINVDSREGKGARFTLTFPVDNRKNSQAMENQK